MAKGTRACFLFHSQPASQAYIYFFWFLTYEMGYQNVFCRLDSTEAKEVSKQALKKAPILSGFLLVSFSKKVHTVTVT